MIKTIGCWHRDKQTDRTEQNPKQNNAHMADLERKWRLLNKKELEGRTITWKKKKKGNWIPPNHPQMN